LTGAFLAALTEMRDAERRAALWETEIIPAAEMLVTSVRASYEAGGLELPVMIDAERALLVATEALATARTTRATRLAELEALGGFDVEALDTADSEESS
jgi:outer membrane protein TolC